MDTFQVLVLCLLSIFYVAYFIKALMLKQRGITFNLLGKGDKPDAARNVELLLRAATLLGAVVQFWSVMFPNIVWSLPTNMPVRISSVVLLLFGNVFFIVAMQTMRENWRAGFDRKQATNLVTTGVYRFSRNPAFVGFDLLYIGCAATFPNIVNIGIAVMAIILFHVQILGEEKYLTETFGEQYSEYKASVMRYIGINPRKLSDKLKVRAKRLKTDVPAVFIALKKKETPLLAKVLSAVTIIYALSPIDLIPDFIPVIGFLDDVLILPGLVAVIIRLIPKDVFVHCREEAESLWSDGKPKKWYYALPIVAVWLLIVFIIVKNMME